MGCVVIRLFCRGNRPRVACAVLALILVRHFVSGFDVRSLLQCSDACAHMYAHSGGANKVAMLKWFIWLICEANASGCSESHAQHKIHQILIQFEGGSNPHGSRMPVLMGLCVYVCEVHLSAPFPSPPPV